MKYQWENESCETLVCDSNSGKTYRIAYRGSGDGDPEQIALWDCDCPAGRYGRQCKHVDRIPGDLDQLPIALKQSTGQTGQRAADDTPTSGRTHAGY